MDKIPSKFTLPSSRPPKHIETSKLAINSKQSRDYSPLPWNHCFSQQLDIRTSDTDIFHVYTLGTEGPVVLLLHGGGHSALSWSLLAENLVESVNCRVLALDSRGHGGTSTRDDCDLSWQRQVQDAADVFNKMYVHQDDTPAPPVVIVGHSMGGAIAVRLSQERLLTSQAGLVVIDVVEGTAMDALGYVHSFLRGRPKVFKSVDEAIEWTVRSGQIKNLLSARISVPGVISPIKIEEVFGDNNIVTTDIPEPTHSIDTGATPVSNVTNNNGYTWRIDLATTESHWKGWFQGLSSLFLSSLVPKVLILAGTDRLDKELTLGQIQGKYQFNVLPKCGHIVHEDAPSNVADIIGDFLVRFKLACKNTH
ncbi:Protein phosphatase methylesterase [Oopsacas minuta]|uniref:Protein phosphatase methylesterase 1 n=1 Tax=Oopsacas minuta TaxID=111878 RepID=A0AAV7K943_9METZ|nr:Protein phosphatase methylesterase [Oopsacas minuta]